MTNTNEQPTFQVAPQTKRIRKRSIAWLYYAVLAIGSVFAIPAAGFSTLMLTALLGLYATYLYRGGRFVIWFW